MQTRQSKKKIYPFDYVILSLVLAGVLFICYRLFFVLEYKWNWQIIPQYLFYIDPDSGGLKMNVLMQGLMTTIKLSLWGTLFATFLGIWMGIMRVSNRLFFRLIGQFYVGIIRNLPPLVLIFIFYFFISDQLLPLFGIEDFFRSRTLETQERLAFLFTEPSLIMPFVSGVLTISFFQGAYITEIVRGGIQAIPLGQWEASAALGLPRWQQLHHVILPQAGRMMLPPLANEFINTIKYSSIVSIISIQELTFQGMQVMASTHAVMEVWITIAAMYLILCLTLSLLVSQLEKRFAPIGA